MYLLLSVRLGTFSELLQTLGASCKMVLAIPASYLSRKQPSVSEAIPWSLARSSEW